MTPNWKTIAATPVAEHEVIVFYDVDGLSLSGGPGLSFRDLCQVEASAPYPEDQRAAMQGRYADEPVWRLAEPDDAGKTAFAIGADLHPHIQAILSGARTDLASRWLLTENAIRLLDRADLYETTTPPEARIRKSIVFAQTPAAQRRLATFGAPVRDIALKIAGVDLTIFETGMGFLQARYAFAPPAGGDPVTSLEILETVYALSRFNNCHWTASGPGRETIGEAFTLGALMRSLCLGADSITKASGRVYTQMFVRFGAALPVEQADLFALYAARHYTSDYETSDTIKGAARVRDFTTVGHTLALEGAATVITPSSTGETPDFLATFRTHTFQAHYVPIVTLALHEREFLVEKTSSALFSREQRAEAASVQGLLVRLLQESLIFRVLFRYTEVSDISMHNAFNRALREVLGLDRMQAEFSGDIAEASAFVERQAELEKRRAEHHRERRFWFLGVIGAGILSALSVGAFVKQILEHGGGLANALAHPLAALGEHNAPNVYSTLAGLLILIGACVVGFAKRPSKETARNEHGRHGELEHVMGDLLIHRTIEGE